MSALKILLGLIILLIPLLVSPVIVHAKSSIFSRQFFNNSVNTSFFPRCPNPGGTQVASYAEGWHWIVGESSLKWGSDNVYHIGQNNYVQCFCSLNQNDTSSFTPQGIQTNWLKVSNITAEQKNLLISQGWILVQNGADFGLLAEPYLAKNSNFSCKGSTCLTKISQNNTATISNNINAPANTGNNNASYNTGGSSTIVTGSASAQVTVVNKVNFNSVSN